MIILNKPEYDEPPSYFDEECPLCKGKCYTYTAINLNTNKEEECNRTFFNNLPDDYDEAIEKGLTYIQGNQEECPLCHGDGIVSRDTYEDYITIDEY